MNAMLTQMSISVEMPVPVPVPVPVQVVVDLSICPQADASSCISGMGYPCQGAPEACLEFLSVTFVTV